MSFTIINWKALWSRKDIRTGIFIVGMILLTLMLRWCQGCSGPTVVPPKVLIEDSITKGKNNRILPSSTVTVPDPDNPSKTLDVGVHDRRNLGGVVTVRTTDSTGKTHGINISIYEQNKGLFPQFTQRPGVRAELLHGDSTNPPTWTPTPPSLIGLEGNLYVGVSYNNAGFAPYVSVTPLRVWGFNAGGFASYAVQEQKTPLDLGVSVHVEVVERLAAGYNYSVTNNRHGVSVTYIFPIW